MRRIFGLPRRRGVRASLVACSLVAGAWFGGFVWFAGTIPTRIADPDSRTDAIVALTGGAERLATAVALLRQKRAEQLFVSGVYRGVEVSELLRAIGGTGDLACCITLGHRADDTRGNARETAAWMAAQSFTSLRLVTANYHMPRSLLEFAHAMPQARIVPHPVFPGNVRRTDWWRWPGTSWLIMTEYGKYLMVRARILAHLP